MSENTKDILADLHNAFKSIKEADPDFYAAFKKFSDEAGKEGALSVKVKELICVALGVAEHCTFCIARHVEKAVLAGATREELIEAGMVAGLMGGGPSLCYMKYIFDAIDQLDIK